jgi:redox-sensitive bicupin YhaK (pirin superfamily)
MRLMNPPSTLLNHPRRVEHLVAGEPTSDGAGVRLTRLLTTRWQRRLDPFLMLDAFRSDDPRDYIAGFPDHPHRGFETITIMVAGRMRHRDSAGHEGLLEAGGVQWMTAGRGIIHSELPEQQDGLMEGFQLWLNLPAADKMCTPRYQDFTRAQLPCWQGEGGVSALVIAGECGGVRGAVQRPITEPLVLDLSLPEGARFEQPLPASRNAFVLAFRGSVRCAGQPLPTGQMAVLASDPDSDGVALEALGAARVLLVAAEPLREPLVQYGPFVMNTADQIRQAVLDYQTGRLA